MDKLKQLSKKTKIIITVAVCIVVLAIIGAILPKDKNNQHAAPTATLKTLQKTGMSTKDVSPSAPTPTPEIHTKAPTSIAATEINFQSPTPQPTKAKISVTLNTSTKVFHVSSHCHNAEKIIDTNREIVEVDDIQEVKNMGYKACGTCSKAYRD